MAKMTKASAKQALADAGPEVAGIDWSKFDLATILKIIQAVWTIWSGGALAKSSALPEAGTDEHAECLKGHFETIKCVADCGIACAEGGGDEEG